MWEAETTPKEALDVCQIIIIMMTTSGKSLIAVICIVVVVVLSANHTSAEVVRCRNRRFPLCFGRILLCPEQCEETCQGYCQTCKALCSCDKPGGVCQDPRFTGGDGIMFYFHGKKEQHFCLVSDSDLHINAHFTAKRGEGMERDFTWVKSIGVIFHGTHYLFLGAKKGCDASVLLNDTVNFKGDKSAPPNSNSLRVCDSIKLLDDCNHLVFEHFWLHSSTSIAYVSMF